MKHSYPLLLSLLLLFLTSCGKEGNDPTPPQPDWKAGINLSTETPDADRSLTITFRAGITSAVYNHSGSLYAHIGVIEGDTWYHLPAEWGINIPKCEMKEIDKNTWQLELKPSIREWFGNPSMPLTKIGLVVRTPDGAKKGLPSDYFFAVSDAGVSLPQAQSRALTGNFREGINIHADGRSVTLVLDDKDKQGASPYKHAYVIGSFNDWSLTDKHAMYRDDAKGLWWITLEGLEPEREYAFQYYLFNEEKQGLRIADPYTLKVLAPEDADLPGTVSQYPQGKTSGYVSTFTLREQAYAWKHSDFVPPAPDDLVIYEMHLRDFSTTGDLKGARARLDELKALGINAIELMPVQEFSGNDSWGYNPIFYFAMDKAYGTREEYKAFVDACHAVGIAVILDVVYNHQDQGSPLYRLYASGGKPLANNPYFNVSAPHPYSVFYDFNHESVRTRELVKRNLVFLLEEYRFDGFRFDLSKGLTQTQSNEATAGQYDASRIAILKEYHSAIQEAKPGAYTILEHFAEEREERELALAGMMLWRNLNHEYAQAAMGWGEQSGFDRLYTGSSMPYGSLVGYMESHDEERVAYKQRTYGNGDIKSDLAKRMKRLQLNAAFFFTVPGPKMLWQYGEYGYDVSINEGGRTGRKPVWVSQLNEVERKELAGIYGKIIALRHLYPDLWDRVTPFAWQVSSSVWSAVRTVTVGQGSRQLIAVGNFQTSSAVEYRLDREMRDALTDEVVPSGTILLQPADFRILITP